MRPTTGAGLFDEALDLAEELVLVLGRERCAIAPVRASLSSSPKRPSDSPKSLSPKSSPIAGSKSSSDGSVSDAKSSSPLSMLSAKSDSPKSVGPSDSL
jgi:hypothetical protein